MSKLGKDIIEGLQEAIISEKDRQIDALKAENAKLRLALEHIALRDSHRECCKFAALAGYRRRHLKEIAREALKERD